MNLVSATQNGSKLWFADLLCFHSILVPAIADSIPDTPEVIHDAHPHQRLEDGDQEHHAHVRISRGHGSRS
jgi:hypothetical protein